jgi:hypothetical protein
VTRSCRTRAHRQELRPPRRRGLPSVTDVPTPQSRQSHPIDSVRVSAYAGGIVIHTDRPVRARAAGASGSYRLSFRELGQVHLDDRGHPEPGRCDLSHRPEDYPVWRGLDGVPGTVPVPEVLLPVPGELSTYRIGVFSPARRPAGDQSPGAVVAVNGHPLPQADGRIGERTIGQEGVEVDLHAEQVCPVAGPAGGADLPSKPLEIIDAEHRPIFAHRPSESGAEALAGSPDAR